MLKEIYTVFLRFHTPGKTSHFPHPWSSVGDTKSSTCSSQNVSFEICM